MGKFRKIVSLILIAFLTIGTSEKAFAYYDICECFTYTLVWVNGERSQTVVQRQKGSRAEGYIMQDERLMCFTSLSAGLAYSNTITIGGTDVNVKRVELVGIDNLARLIIQGVCPKGGKVSTINPDYDDDKPGDEAGTITGFDGSSPLADIYHFNKRTYYKTSGELVPAGEEKVEFFEAYEVVVTSDEHGTASAKSTLSVANDTTFGIQGTTVMLQATPENGYMFREWQIVSGHAKIDDPTSEYTSFRFDTEDVEIKAVFGKGKEIVLDGLDPKTGKESKLRIFQPTEPVSYNGRTHVKQGTELSEKQCTKKCNDLDFTINGLPETVKPRYIYKKTKEASDDQAYYYVKLVENKDSVSYNQLSKSEIQSLKAAIKQGNKILKKKENRIVFPIEKLDLSDFVYDRDQSSENKKVFVRSSVSSDRLTLQSKKITKKNPDSGDSSSYINTVLYAKIAGHTAVIPRKEYNNSFSEDDVTLSWKGKNLTGTTK